MPVKAVMAATVTASARAASLAKAATSRAMMAVGHVAKVAVKAVARDATTVVAEVAATVVASAKVLAASVLTPKANRYCKTPTCRPVRRMLAPQSQDAKNSAQNAVHAPSVASAMTAATAAVVAANAQTAPSATKHAPKVLLRTPLSPTTARQRTATMASPAKRGKAARVVKDGKGVMAAVDAMVADRALMAMDVRLVMMRSKPNWALPTLKTQATPLLPKTVRKQPVPVAKMANRARSAHATVMAVSVAHAGNVASAKSVRTCAFQPTPLPSQ